MNYLNFIFWLVGIVVSIVTIMFMCGELILAAKDVLATLTNHINKWNRWRKHSDKSKFEKFLVLLGIKKSTDMILVLSEDEAKRIYENIENGAISLDKHGYEYVTRITNEIKEAYPEWFKEVDSDENM